MKYTSAVLALAAMAVAAPTPTGSDAGKCNNNSNNPHFVCCSDLLLGLLCSINILGNSCSGGTYCCSSEVTQSGLINIGGLGCLKLN